MKEEQSLSTAALTAAAGQEQITTTTTTAADEEEVSSAEKASIISGSEEDEEKKEAFDESTSVVLDSETEANKSEKEDCVALFTVNEYVIRKMIYKENQYGLPPLHLIMKYFSRNLEQLIFDVLDSTSFQEKLTRALPEFKLSGLKNSILLDSDIERVTSVIDEAIAKKQSKVFINY